MNRFDWVQRFRNKYFITSLVSSIILLLNQLGLNSYIPSNIMDILNTVLCIFSLLGVVIDPTSKGICDNKVEK